MEKLELCPHVSLVHIEPHEVQEFFEWLDHEVIEFVRANNRYARPDQVRQFLANIKDLKKSVFGGSMEEVVDAAMESFQP